MCILMTLTVKKRYIVYNWLAMKDDIYKYREFLKDTIRLKIDFTRTDQSLGKQIPLIEKPFNKDKEIFSLPPVDNLINKDKTLLSAAFKKRKSHRKFLPESLSIEEISYLLWATQGIRKKVRDVVLRTVPSAGNRHSLETYLLVTNVEELKPGVYRYLPLEHRLVFESFEDNLQKKIVEATLGQYFIGTAPVVIVWTSIPYRMEWRYSKAAHKVIAIDVGHVCQNLYLACEAIKAGTCAVAAYNQELMDKLIGIDGEDEFTIYLAPVGKINS